MDSMFFNILTVMSYNQQSLNQIFKFINDEQKLCIFAQNNYKKNYPANEWLEIKVRHRVVPNVKQL